MLGLPPKLQHRHLGDTLAADATAADAGAENALAVALSELRQKVCSEIAVVEQLLAAYPPGWYGPTSGAPAGPLRLGSSAAADAARHQSIVPCPTVRAATASTLGLIKGSAEGIASVGAERSVRSDSLNTLGDLVLPADAEGSGGGKLSGNVPVDCLPMHVCSGLSDSDFMARERTDSYARGKSSTPRGGPSTPRGGETAGAKKFRHFSDNRCFEAFFVCMILANSFLLAAEVQYQSHHIDEPQPWQFTAAAFAFSFLFCVEFICRVWGDGVREFFCGRGKKRWAVLDTAVVLLAAIEVAAYVAAHHSPITDASGMSIMRALRGARLFRSFRALRLFWFMSELRALTVSIFATLKSVAMGLIAMIFVMFLFGVTFTDSVVNGLGVEHDPGLQDYWGSLDRAMITLFQTVANGISWRDAYECLRESSSVAGWLFLAFISFTYFVLINVLIGVFCNAAIDSANKSPEVIAQSMVAGSKADEDTLATIFRQIDNTQSGSITIADFEVLLDDEVVRAKFHAMGLDIHDAWMVFKLLDTDRNGTVSEHEFVFGVQALKGGSKNTDVAALRHESRVANRKLLEHLGRIEAMVRRPSFVE